MRGRILHFSLQESEGFITTDEGGRYKFAGSEWKSEGSPQKGQLVDFEVREDGRAVAVYSLPEEGFQSNAAAQGAAIGDAVTKNLPSFMQLQDKPKSAYNPIDWFLYCIHNYANFNGRAGRSEFWYFVLGTIILYIIAGVIDVTLFGTSYSYGIFELIVMLALLLPGLAVSARRLHDTGKSGWWYLLTLIPLIGIIILIIWWASRGSDTANAYGEPVKV